MGVELESIFTQEEIERNTDNESSDEDTKE